VQLTVQSSLPMARIYSSNLPALGRIWVVQLDIPKLSCKIAETPSALRSLLQMCDDMPCSVKRDNTMCNTAAYVVATTISHQM